MAMKLVFQGGEHPQFPLPEGSSSIGSALEADVPLGNDGIEPLHCELLVGAHGVRLRVIPGARVLVNDRPAKASAQVKAGDTIEIQFGSKNVKVEVLDIKETVRKEDAENLFRYL